MLKPVIPVELLRRGAYFRCAFLALAFAASMAVLAPSCPAQKTETEATGSGHDSQGNPFTVKVEVDRDKNGNVIERRQYRNGRLIRRSKYYPRVSGPPDSRTDTYGPDGATIQTETDRVTDGNGNVTESVTTYDKDGKVIKQTKTVTTRTGEKRCYERSNDQAAYEEVRCPGVLTQEEIQHSMQLAAERMRARRAKDEEDRKTKQPENRSAQLPAQQSSSTVTVGVVLPAGASGEISGIVTDEPKRYSGVPGLQVVEIPVQLATGENGKPTLEGLQVSTGGGQPQPAHDPIVCPPGAQRTLTLTPSGNTQAAVTRPLNIPQKTSSGAAGTTAPPICVRGRVAVVHRTFQGDSTRTLLALGDLPIIPAAENQDAAYFLIPEDTRPGLTRINVAEGSQAASVPVCVLALATSVDQPSLHKNQETNVHVQITGPEELPEEAWRAGYSPDLVDLAQLHALVPNFQPPGPGEPGIVYVFMQNLSPDVITMEGAQGQTRVFALSRESFPFSWTGKVRAIRDGKFNIHVLAVPFLAEVPGQQIHFENTETGPDLGPPNPAPGGQPGAQPPSDPVAQHLKEMNAALKKALDALAAGDYPGAQNALDDAASIKMRMLLGDPFGGTSTAGTTAAGWISFIADFDALLRDADSSAPTIPFFGSDGWAKLKKKIEDAKKLKDAIEARVPPELKSVLDYLRAMNIALNQALNAADNHDFPGVRKALADAVKAKWDLVFKGPFGVKIHGVSLSRWMAFEEYFDDKIRAARGLLAPGFFPWWPKDSEEAKKLIEKAEEVKKQIEAEGKTASRNP